MHWLLASPGHQHPRYWLYKTDRTLSSMRKDFNYPCHISVEECKYMYISVEKFSTFRDFSLALGQWSDRINHNQITTKHNKVSNPRIILWRHVPFVLFCLFLLQCSTRTLQWRHNRRDGVSNHQHHDCLPNRLFRRRSKKTSQCLNKRLSKQWWCWWFETPSRSLWRHCNDMLQCVSPGIYAGNVFSWICVSCNNVICKEALCKLQHG